MRRQLVFSPDALAAYRRLRADLSGELGRRIKAALERLIDNPAAARGDSARWNSLLGPVWSLSVSDPDDGMWLIIWAERDSGVIEIFYVGPAPGETRSALAWPGQTE